ANCSDGAGPNAGLIQALNGNFYGTTDGGGSNNFGTIFEITPAGKLTTVYTFCSQSGCSDGANPSGGLLQGSDGNFYGTTAVGGAFGAGSVFKITPAGAFTTVASFDGSNGDDPAFGSLIQATDGNFYGTTLAGGASTACGSGCGTVFKLTPRGKLTMVYSFCAQINCTDGFELFGGLVQGSDGNLYGTTAEGGANGYGTVFKLTTAGKLTTLHSFASYPDGAYPEAAPIQGTDGNFYGTTPNGGTNGVAGTVFQITPSGALTTLYDFCAKTNCADGTGPFEGLMQATNGKFYGTAFGGGASTNCIGGCGTAFSLAMGLGPFIEVRLNSGRLGSHVQVLGNNLTGATAVNFNGTPAAFTVRSATELTATVPAGATTGLVMVVTPNGTLTSNQPFRVIP
ncbi:MAG: choice-of-anchor tandem repeat GloVer-containing protein, partial [Candidatus Sulfotelmatobacter sp.]